MPTVFCICEKCGEHFYSKDELYLSGIKMRFKIARNNQQPKTWDDWVHHLSTNCENCRLKPFQKVVKQIGLEANISCILLCYLVNF
jgi:hypothetical protein